jgi:hypothetical protein
MYSLVTESVVSDLLRQENISLLQSEDYSWTKVPLPDWFRQVNLNSDIFTYFIYLLLIYLKTLSVAKEI